MAEEYHIREAIETDTAAMLNFLETVADETDYLTFGSGETNLSQEEEREVIRHLKSSPNSFILVVVENQTHQIIGCLTFRGGKTKRIRHAGELGISILKEYWGQGIAKALISRLIEWAQKNPIIKKINLTVRFDNQRAIKLYKKFGFNEEGTISRDFLIDGVFYESLIMGLNID